MLIDLFQALTNYGAGSDIFRSLLIQLLLYVPVFMLSLSFHEAGHAYIAYRCGDPTAYMLGRMTLNPAKHLDPVGTLLLFTVGFGWAKPVPVNPRNYRNLRRDDLKVSMAGIGANLLLMLIAAVLEFLLLWIAYANGLASNQTVAYIDLMLQFFIMTNLTLAAFNLLPIPPLDGYHLFNDVFFKRRLFAPQTAQRIGQALLIVLVFSGATGYYLGFVRNNVLGGIEYLMELALNAVL